MKTEKAKPVRIFGRSARFSRQRFPGTVAMARLGIIAAVLSGISVAFQFGGWDGYALPMSGLLGAPTNIMLFKMLSAVLHLRPMIVAQKGPASVWSAYHVLWFGSIALNWTLLGLVSDLFGEHPRSTAALTETLRPERLSEADMDPLLRDFEELARRRRGSHDSLKDRAA